MLHLLENYLAIKPQSFVEKSSLVVEELQFVQWAIFIWATQLYLVPFASYLTLNNIVTLKSGLEVTQGH